MEKILFYILGFIALVSAVLTVTTVKIYRAVLYLLFALLSIAGIYFMMNYDFIGAVQLSVYAGGIMVLFVYTVMLTEKPGEAIRKIAPFRRIIAGVSVIALMILALIAIWKFDFNQAGESQGITIEQVGKAMLNYGKGGFILPFEVISVLLLAVMVAAIVVAKSKKSKVE
jgi:NADH-quinone oxidoreductase subunit J